MRIGFHSSISSSFERAALKAHELGANTFQIFSASPRMWRAALPRQEEALALQNTRKQLELWPLVIHDNYLINLPAANPSVRKNSIAGFRGELQRALILGAEYLVMHPGSFREQTRDTAIEAFADSMEASAKGLSSANLMILLENTAGAGSALGSRFEELAVLRERSVDRVGFPIGYCLDTCHMLAAGYNLLTAEGLEATLGEADRYLGLSNVPVIHANDSKGGLGSHLDRHENIGKGQIGEEAFRRILRRPELRDKAYILETPGEEDDDYRADILALRRLSE